MSVAFASEDAIPGASDGGCRPWSVGRHCG